MKRKSFIKASALGIAGLWSTKSFGTLPKKKKNKLLKLVP